jgi:uncharacterized protein DUF5666
MRRSLVAASVAVALLSPVIALACTGIGKGAPPAMGSGAPEEKFETGTVTSVDAAAMTFSCHWKTGDWTYQVTADTAFHQGGAKVRFADLKPGAVVKVKYHFEGKTEVADTVTIEPAGWGE